MNNTDKAEAVRFILSQKLTGYTKQPDIQELELSIAIRKISEIKVNDKNYKTIKAINYLLNNID